MLEQLEELRKLPFFNEGAGSLALVLGLLLLRSLAARAIRRSRLAEETRRLWLIHSRNTALVAILLGLVVIWGPEVRSLAFSLVAVAAALAIATKELILCVAGAFVRTSSGAFSVGDRIEVAGVRGDVIDLGAFTTTVLEVGPGPSYRTGRAVVLPNSVFVVQPVANETFTGEYLLDTLAVPVERDGDWQRHEQALLTAARTECEPFLEAARQQLTRSAARLGLEPSGVDPRVSLRLVDAKRLDLLVRFPAPERQRARVEQDLLRRYLAALAEAEPGVQGGE